MGSGYKDQINKLRNTDLDFLYVTKDTRNNCSYINSAIHNLKIDIDNLFNNNGSVFKEIGYIVNAVEYYDIVIYAIV